jgi:type-F conjugative transfer system pilin assembly protein TrbC
VGSNKEAGVLRRVQLNRSIIAFALTLVPTLAGAAGFIETPDECYMVKTMDKPAKTVQLAAMGRCQGRPGRAFVDLDGEVTVFRDGAIWKRQTVQSMSMPDLVGTMAKAKEMAKSMVLPKNAFEKEMQAKAAETIAVYRSPEYQAKLARETARIKRDMFHEELEALPADKGGLKQVKALAKQESPKRARLQDDERIYVFISSSMPMETIRNYAASAGQYNDPKKVVLVMRGFIGGMQKIGPTTSFVADVLKRSATCNLAAGEQCDMVNTNVLIDPILFRRYGIREVPATVYAKGVRVNLPEQSEGNDDVVIGSFAVAYGDASLEYNLSKIAGSVSR